MTARISVKLPVPNPAPYSNGGPWHPAIMTDEHSASLYGQPVVVVDGETDPRGPAEVALVSYADPAIPCGRPWNDSAALDSYRASCDWASRAGTAAGFRGSHSP